MALLTTRTTTQTTARITARKVAVAIAGLATVSALGACGSTASNSAGVPSEQTGDVTAICQQIADRSSCGITSSDVATPSNKLPANKAPRGQAATVLHLYFGGFYSLNAGQRYVYSGVTGAFTLKPGTAGPNSGTFQMNENFTQGLSMQWSFPGGGSYTYSPASDVYEFQFDPGRCPFGLGTLTAANDQLIGTLTLDGNISTTFAIPYTTE